METLTPAHAVFIIVKTHYGLTAPRGGIAAGAEFGVVLFGF
jgi:hypothetical protein